MPTIDEIKTAILDREADLERKFREERIIPRDALPDAEKLLGKDAALVITGPRRCGKSILSYMLGQGKKSAYISFDDERLIMPASKLNIILEAAYSLKGEIDLLILDEIQNISGWEIFVSRLLASKKVILTGSNARLLSSELSTHLTGRHIDLGLFPFSFREFLAVENIPPKSAYTTAELARIKALFCTYLEGGGFPLARRLKGAFLAETYRDILERDAMQRHKIMHLAAFRELAKYLISNSSKEISFNKLKGILGLESPHTVKDYVSYLSGAYLVFLIERFSFKLKEQMIAPKKVYCIDNGIINSVGFRVSQNLGRAMENLVAIELFRRTAKSKNSGFYYWKDHQQREVDFAIREGTRISSLIQVTGISSKKELEPRETDSLFRAGKELKCKNLLVITSDYEGEDNAQASKIRFVPLWKWLLSE